MPLFVLLVGWSTPAVAQIVAFPLVTGPKPAGRGLTAKGVVAGLEKAGLEVLRGDVLEGAAEELGVSVYSTEVARVAGCDYLAVVRLVGRRGRFVAQGSLRRVDDGEVVLEVERRYRKKSQANKAGRALGARFAAAIAADASAKAPAELPVAAPQARTAPVRPEPVAPPPPREDVGAPPPTRAVRPREPPPSERAERNPPPAVEAPRSTARRSTRRTRRPEASVQRERPRKAAASTTRAERKVLRLAVSGGTRSYSAYSIVVQDQATSHSYSLDPLLALGAHAVFTVPSTGLLFEADFGFMPVRFGIATNPPVMPTDPSGQFIDIGGNVGWRFDIGAQGDFHVTPLVGVDYGALLVESQGLDTIVNEYSTFALGGGLRLGLEIGDAFAFDIEGELGAILGFSEAPVITGESGSGLRVATRGRARWWPTSVLGAELALRYEYRGVDLQGAAQRTEFMADPPIMDARVLSEALDLTVGVVLAF